MNAPTSHDHLAPLVQPRDVPAALLDALAQRFGQNCSTAQIVREQHGRDESAYTTVPPPAAVIFAESTDDVAQAVRMAAAYNVPIIPFGVGTSLEGHLLAVQGGISIDLGRMNKVLSINAEDLTVTVQPGWDTALYKVASAVSKRAAPSVTVMVFCTTGSAGPTRCSRLPHFRANIRCGGASRKRKYCRYSKSWASGSCPSARWARAS